jgi:hypothetical protein
MWCMCTTGWVGVTTILGQICNLVSRVSAHVGFTAMFFHSGLLQDVVVALQVYPDLLIQAVGH